MITIPGGIKVFIATEPTDMRRGFDSLAAMVQGVLKKDIFSGHLFVFRDRSGSKLKILYWDRNGYVIWYKRLSQGKFRFPQVTEKVFAVSSSELNLLLEGIELTHYQRLSAV